jgi:hypothetical protein
MATVSYGSNLNTVIGGLSPYLSDLVQTGFLERYLEIGLNSVLGYNRLSLRETIPNGVGESVTKSKYGRKSPVTRPLNPSFMSSFDSGLQPSGYQTEQYSYTMQPYGDSADVNLLQAEVLIADQLKAFSYNNGVQAAQSLDRIAKMKLFAAYDTGNTFATATGTTTTVHVDDIRGFQTVLYNGRPTAVTASTPLTCVEISASTGQTVQTLTVTSVAADAVNTSIFPSGDPLNFVSDGISGTLTFSTATAPVSGDAIISSQAPTIIRPNARVTTTALTAADIISMGTIFDAVTQLRNNAVPPMANGQYETTLSNTSLRQLFADQDFKVLFAGRDQSSEFRAFDIISMFGVTFVPNTEAYQQNPATDGSVSLSVKVDRPIVSGDGAILRGDFEGLTTWLNKDGVTPVGTVMLVDGIAQVLRPPMDRLQTTVSLSWMWVGDYAIPTDLTATPSIIPTASSAAYKRALVIEHASS